VGSQEIGRTFFSFPPTIGQTKGGELSSCANMDMVAVTQEM
jgi:hypothetical protein